ncbi:MAG: helix-turn-helix transcriptional regulator [Planctomycetes bacterium]|nr:helix-turn-helix transcriptional regulator [Planctomycetota bacterium]
MTKKQAKLIDQVRQAATEYGGSQNALAEAIGLDPAALSRFVTGKAGLSMESLDALGKVLELRIAPTGKKLNIPQRPTGRPKKTT